jgi:hypothetical protein
MLPTSFAHDIFNHAVVLDHLKICASELTVPAVSCDVSGDSVNFFPVLGQKSADQAFGLSDCSVRHDTALDDGNDLSAREIHNEKFRPDGCMAVNSGVRCTCHQQQQNGANC